jgi:thiamine biosynthesis lipoprotein ApbE
MATNPDRGGGEEYKKEVEVPPIPIMDPEPNSKLYSQAELDDAVFKAVEETYRTFEDQVKSKDKQIDKLNTKHGNLQYILEKQFAALERVEIKIDKFTRGNYDPQRDDYRDDL